MVPKAIWIEPKHQCIDDVGLIDLCFSDAWVLFGLKVCNIGIKVAQKLFN